MKTPIKQKVKISLEDKAKIIEESKKPGFNKKQAKEKYGRTTIISNILKNQTQILKELDRFPVVEGFNKNSKLVRRKIINNDMEFLQLQGLTDFLPIILSYLDNKNLCQFRLTCKQLAEMIREKNIWRFRIITHIKGSQNRVSQVISFCYFNLIPNPTWMLNEVELNSNSLESLEEFAKRFGQAGRRKTTLEIDKIWKKATNKSSLSELLLTRKI